MKILRNKLNWLTAVLSLLLVTSCMNDLQELNRNPNQPEEVPTEYLLSYAQELMLDQMYGGFDNSRVGMTLAQYWSQNQYTEESRYQYRAGTLNTTWNSFYTGIYNLQEVIRLNEESEALRSENQIAVARIMRAWAFQFLTDVFGDIPYTEALNAVEGNVSPAYTPQSEIYPDLLKELQEASAQINMEEETPGFGGGDLIYGGDMTKWKKFANALILRVAIRMADRMEAQSLAAIEGAYQEAFQSNEDNAMINYLASQPNTHPLYVDVVVNGRVDYSSSNVLVDRLLELNDPRLPQYFEPAGNSDGEFIGRPFGQNSANANAQDVDDVSQLSERVLSPDFPGVLMDYAEVNFILAEAAARGANVGGTAAEYYGDGIRASMNWWGVENDGQIDQYIAAHPYNPADFRQSIGEQKWIALYMQGFQGWIEYRRLDFDNILQMPVDGALININQVPVRRMYPPDEQTLNRTNYQEAVARIGADDLTTKVWWDVN